MMRCMIVVVNMMIIGYNPDIAIVASTQNARHRRCGRFILSTTTSVVVLVVVAYYCIQ